jgi:hypothetical protein
MNTQRKLNKVSVIKRLTACIPLVATLDVWGLDMKLRQVTGKAHTLQTKQPIGKKMKIEEYTCEECGATANSKTKDTCDYCVMKFFTEDPRCVMTISSHAPTPKVGK